MNEQTEQTRGAEQERPQYQYLPQLQHGRGGGWIMFLRVFLWIEFALVIAGGVVVFALYLRGERALEGILILIGSVLLAFLSVAVGMVLLDAAQNLRSLTDNSAQIGFSILRQERQRK